MKEIASKNRTPVDKSGSSSRGFTDSDQMQKKLVASKTNNIPKEHFKTLY